MTTVSNKNRGNGGETPPRQRKSIRLSEYDYSQFGYYFITICTQNRELCFENNDVKQIIDTQWRELKNKFDNIDLDEYVVMPNHLHGIIIITRRGGVTPPAYGVTPPATNGSGNPTNGSGNPTNGSGNPTPTMTLGQIIAYFKYQSTKNVNIVLENPPGTKLWQRNYYEHIIRNDESLNRIRYYIKTNPENWETDSNNPKNIKH